MQGMKFLARFRKILERGKYIFHVHTNYTDGLSSVVDYFEYAQKNGISDLIFTEHVRKELSYSFDDFFNNIKVVGKRFTNVKAIIGVEAKIIPGGELDIPQSILSKIEVVCIACHSFPDDVSLYVETFEKIFKDKYLKDYVRVWVHPGRFFRKRNKLDENKNILEELIKVALSEEVFIEQNLKEDLPPLNLLEKIPYDKIVVGYDAHSVTDLEVLREKEFFRKKML